MSSCQAEQEARPAFLIFHQNGLLRFPCSLRQERGFLRSGPFRFHKTFPNDRRFQERDGMGGLRYGNLVGFLTKYTYGAPSAVPGGRKSSITS